MRHSLVDYFAHLDIALFVFATIMGLIACGGAVIMMRFERFAEPARAETVRALAGACLGGGVWAAYFLYVLAMQPAVMFGFNFGLTMLSGFLAIVGGAFAMARYGLHISRGWRSAALAAGVIALSFLAMQVLGFAAIDAAARKQVQWDRAAEGGLGIFLALWVALVLLSYSEKLQARAAGAVILSLGVLSFCVSAAISVEIFFDPNLPAPDNGLSPLVLAFIICVIAVGLLVSAMAFVIIDRSLTVSRLTAESMASKLADAALEGLIVHDGTTLLEVNSRFSWLAGDGTESVRGQSLSDFFDAEALSAIHQTMAEGGEGLFETTLQGADTEVEICTRLYDRAAGQYVTAVRDLSMRKRIDSAERANLAKSQFLANMSHELRTPLNAIIGYSEMIIEDSEDKGAARDAGEINVAAKNMLALVNDIVDLSRIEDGKIEFVFDLCDLNEMIGRLNKRFAGAAQAQGLQLSIEADENAVDAIIDEKRIEQCLAQLLSNAVKFTEKGGVSVRLYAEDGDFKATVRDSGIGICPNRATQLFEAFSQGDGSIARRYGGVGVGLALTSRLITLMGGSLELETAEGQGSTFTLITPSDPDPDILALRRKAGAHARVIKVIARERDKAA
jgi:signal transduction histidine kinase/NO-binding membrane sensor protein with MHYT domain